MRTTPTKPESDGPKCPLTGLPINPETGQILNPNPVDRALFPAKGRDFADSMVDALRERFAKKTPDKR